MSCVELSAAADEQLVGTAAQARRWLMVEVHGAWGRDVVSDSDLPHPVKERLARWVTEAEGGGRVLFIRKPERRRADTTAVFIADVDELGGTCVRLDLARVGDLATIELDPAAARGSACEMLLLVCTHGRRDACCARLGVPLYGALRPLLAPDEVWQCSHLGGHRFAGNVLVLPHGMMLGRVDPVDALHVVQESRAGRIPLGNYRGRVLYDPEAQAAELAIREQAGAPRLEELRYLGSTGEPGGHGFMTPNGEVSAVVEALTGRLVPPSCGTEPEPTTRFATRLQGL